MSCCVVWIWHCKPHCLRCLITHLWCLDRQVNELLCGMKSAVKAALPVVYSYWPVRCLTSMWTGCCVACSLQWKLHCLQCIIIDLWGVWPACGQVAVWHEVCSESHTTCSVQLFTCEVLDQQVDKLLCYMKSKLKANLPAPFNYWPMVRLTSRWTSCCVTWSLSWKPPCLHHLITDLWWGWPAGGQVAVWHEV